MTKFKELRELVIFLAHLYGYTAKALEDKKISVSEVITGAFMIGPELRPAFEGIANIKKEFNGSTEAERKQLRDEIVSELGLSNPYAAEIVTSLMDMALSAAHVVNLFGNKPAKG